MVNYTYDSDGIRTAKTVNGTETTYQLDGTKIISETTNRNIKWYIYDENDSIIGFEYNDKVYYFEKNAQSDVVRIFDADGNFVSEYFYDAWGNIASISGNEEIANANPFRYRGYYYDNESGFYYLQSRYYDSFTGRFLNADSIIGANGDITSNNLFAYCSNNPIMNVDPTGNISISTIIGAIIGFGAGAIFLPMLASKWGLKGWKKNAFVALGISALTILGGLLGKYAGKAIASLYAKGGSFSQTLNKAIAKTIAKFTKASYSTAKGNGFILKLKKFTVRIMSSGGGRTNYIRISHATKGAMDICGKYTSNRAYTHIDITLGNLVKLIKLMSKW